MLSCAPYVFPILLLASIAVAQDDPNFRIACEPGNGYIELEVRLFSGNPCGTNGPPKVGYEIWIHWQDPWPNDPGSLIITGPNWGFELRGSNPRMWGSGCCWCPEEVRAHINQQIQQGFAGVYLWKGSNSTSPCSPTGLPSYFCCAPEEWEPNNGTAYVIVGDVSPHSSVVGQVMTLAAQRLTDSGYNVVIRGTTANPATRDQVIAAISDPTVRAVVLIAHGGQASFVRSTEHALEMANSEELEGSIIGVLRLGMEPLEELRLYSCSAGIDPDVELDWNISTNSDNHIWYSVDLTPDFALIEEQGDMCHCAQESESGNTPLHEPYVLLPLLKGQGGESALALYEPLSGYQHVEQFPSGAVNINDGSLGLDLSLTTAHVDEPIRLFATKFASSPTEKTPSGSIILLALQLIASVDDLTGSATFMYEQSLIDEIPSADETSLRLWLYDGQIDDYVALPIASHDLDANSLQFPMDLTGKLSGLLVLTIDHPCYGDTNWNGSVDVEDLLNVLSSWGTTGEFGDGDSADISNSDGLLDVNVVDLLAVLANWGPC